MADDRQSVFSDLYQEASADVWRFLRRRVSTSEDADDLTSDVFAVAWRRVDVLPPADEQRLWLFGVARNVLRNHERSRSRRERLTQALASAALLNGGATSPPDDRDDALWQALARLRSTEREVLMMRSWDELSVTEIASLLEISPNAVSVRLSKARAKLRRHLEQKDRATPGDERHDPAPQGARSD